MKRTSHSHPPSHHQQTNKISSDTTPTLQTALSTFSTRHPSTHTPTQTDILFLRTLARHITRRSASLVAASLYALWELKAEAERDLLTTVPKTSEFAAETAAEIEIAERGKTSVAYTGSVVEQYPGYRGALQGFVDALLGEDNGKGKGGEIVMVGARESSLRGAAVALACLS